MQSLSDRTAFHLAGIGATVVGAASRLRETGDFACCNDSLEEAERDLVALSEIVRLIQAGNQTEAKRLLDDLAYGRVLRRLT